MSQLFLALNLTSILIHDAANILNSSTGAAVQH